MVAWRLSSAGVVAAMVVAAVSSVDAAPTTASVSQYVLQTADTGSCRLKGIDSNSDNFKFYASVSAKDAAVNDGCARCIKVTKDGVATSLTAYVLDVCQGCKAGELKLSSAALTQLAIDANSNNATVSYKFANCPTSFLAGNIKACLMEGASNSYIPLQFYNSQKAIVGVNISGIAATQNKDSFFFFASPQTGNGDTTQWFKNVQVTLTSDDGEAQTAAFEFGGTSGCATSAVQFSVSSTGDASDGGAAGSSKKGKDGDSSVLVPALLGGVGALLLIVGSVFFIMRRRRASANDTDTPRDGLDNQYLSPTDKSNNNYPRSPERPTYAADNSLHNSTDLQSDEEPNSPTIAFDDAVTPVAASAASRNVYGAGSVQQQPQQQQQYQYESSSPVEQQTQQQAIAAGAPRVTYSSYMAPQSFAFSKPVDTERAATTNSFRGSVRAAPTFPAPVLPPRAHSDDDDDAGSRSSFDIDDMRETEEIKERERYSSLTNEMQTTVAPYHSESAYSSGHVTSPQSYVRATSLRRNSTKVPTSDRPTLRFTSTLSASQSSSEPRQDHNSDSFGSGYSDRDSYASDAFARNTTGSSIDAVNPPSRDSFRDSSSGYSRESLGILGYPFAKKPSGGRNSSSSITEAQL